MSTKNNVHSSESTRGQSTNHSRELLFVVGLVLAIVLAVVLVNFQGGTNNILSATPQMVKVAPEVSYRDALSMSNAQTVESDTAFDYDEALAITQYTQPWTNPHAEVYDPASRYIEAQAASITQSFETISTAEYREAITAANNQSTSYFSAASYDEILAIMQFNQPWLNPDAEPYDPAARYIEALALPNE